MCVATTATAESKTSCLQVIEACDKALEMKNLALTQRKEQVDDLTKKLDDANAKLESPLRNPLYMILAGLVVGIAITK